MNKKQLALILGLGLVLVLGYLWSQVSSDNIQRQIKKMSLEEKVGQLVMVGVAGYEIDKRTQKLIETDHIGGIIFFKRNIKDIQQTLALVDSLHATNSVNKIPLFLAVDEEGGRVSRIPDESQQVPTSQELGEINSAELSYQVGRVLGARLKLYGLNMNFAPVLDINSNPDNPVIGDRSFGAEATVVSKLGIETMLGLQSQGIISVVKHFPGHGDTGVDSHIGLPAVNHDLERLRSFELVPFAAAVENKVDAIMIAHILLPQIDPDNPATFSKAIITDLLREEMGFTGVVITDDLTMGAIVNNFEIGAAAVNSINAGSDIVLVCHGYDQEEAVIRAIQEAVKTGVISQKRIDQSVYRILKLKEKYGL